MKTNRTLAREIHRIAREKLLASEILWKDYKRMRWARWRRLRLSRPVILLYPVLLIGVFGQRANNELLILMLTLYCTATVFGRSTQFVTTLYRSTDLAFFMHAPVTDREFFDHEWPRFFRASLFVWFCAASVFVLLVFRQPNRDAEHFAAALAAATLQWFVVLALCIGTYLLPRRFIDMRIGIALYVLTFASIFFPKEWVDGLKTIVGPLPTAWVPRIFERGVLGHDASTLPLVAAVVALLVLLPLGFRRMRNQFPIVELVYPFEMARVTEGEEEVAEGDVATGSLGHREAHDQDVVHAERKELIPVRLPSLDWATSGWIERIAGDWLNQREKQVAAFLCGGKLGRWSAEWRMGIKIAAIGVGTMFLPMLLPDWVCLAAGAVASLSALPVFGGGWDGMQLTAVSGAVGPAYAGFPLSFSEMTRVLLKVNLVRYAVWSPIFLMYSGGLALRAGMPVAFGLSIGTEILIALLAAQWIFIVGQHANGTNDTKRFTLHSVTGLVAVLLIGMIFVAAVIFFFVTLSWSEEAGKALGAVAALGMFLSSWLVWVVYRLLYNRGRIDLMRLPNRA